MPTSANSPSKKDDHESSEHTSYGQVIEYIRGTLLRAPGTKDRTTDEVFRPSLSSLLHSPSHCLHTIPISLKPEPVTVEAKIEAQLDPNASGDRPTFAAGLLLG